MDLPGKKVGMKGKKRVNRVFEPYSEPHAASDDQAVAPGEVMVAPVEHNWFQTEIIDHCPSPAYELHRSPSPPCHMPTGPPFGSAPFECPTSSQPLSVHFSPLTRVRSIPDLPRSQSLIHRTVDASVEDWGPSPPTAPTMSPLQPPIDLSQVFIASRPPAPIPGMSSVPTADLQPTALDPVTRTVVLISGISATLSARLQFSHQSLLEPVFQAFAERILKTKAAIVADEVGALLKKYATGFNYDGIQRVREETMQAFMHNWVQMGLDCATSAKEIISKDVCESIIMQLQVKNVKSTLGETLLETVKPALDQCLARTKERIKELAQDHMVIMDTRDRQTLAIKATALRDQVFRGVQVSDNVRTVASEVHAYFNVSSGQFIDGCIRIILRQLMHQLSLRLSSELFDALKLSEADLPERCRIWVK